ncbi:hypothetical protein HanRHA438_Chr03g0140091 [Helianthus annuus]|nr:hypothetical protein HanRHA438_Chr03g0140091 [Helianthus annuus]KAJ0957571.1 hypothetical protein HanPSC8_Chr01g0028911 [Helianthus annuus]
MHVDLFQTGRTQYTFQFFLCVFLSTRSNPCCSQASNASTELCKIIEFVDAYKIYYSNRKLIRTQIKLIQITLYCLFS